MVGGLVGGEGGEGECASISSPPFPPLSVHYHHTPPFGKVRVGVGQSLYFYNGVETIRLQQGFILFTGRFFSHEPVLFRDSAAVRARGHVEGKRG